MYCLSIDTWGEFENLYFCYRSSVTWCSPRINNSCNINVGLCTAGPWHHSFKTSEHIVHFLFPHEPFSSRRLMFSINRTWQRGRTREDCQVSNSFYVNNNNFFSRFPPLPFTSPYSYLYSYPFPTLTSTSTPTPSPSPHPSSSALFYSPSLFFFFFLII